MLREQLAEMARHVSDQAAPSPYIQGALSTALVAAGLTLDAVESTVNLISLLIGATLGIITIYAVVSRRREEKQKFNAWKRDRQARKEAAKGPHE